MAEAYIVSEPLKEVMINSEHLINGANLLMHDRKWTADALEAIVTGLRNKGFEVVDPLLIETN